MEYQLKKKQILQTVEFTNLLSFALTENKLEKNFKSIVDALLLNQADHEKTREDLTNVQQNHSKEIQELRDRFNLLQGRLFNHKGASKENISQRMSLVPDEEIEENMIPSIRDEIISEPQLVFNIVESAKDTDIDMNSIHNLDKKQALNNQKIDELMKEVNNLKESQLDANNLEKTITGMKDNIKAIKAELQALSQRAEKQKESKQRISIRNNMNEQKENKENTMKSLKESGDDKKSKNKIENEGDEKGNMGMESQINGLKEDFQKEMNGLYMEINTLKLCLEELKEESADSRRKDNKTGIQIDDLQKNLKKVQNKMDEDQEDFQKQLKDIKMQLLNNPIKNSNEGTESIKKSKKLIEGKEPGPNYNSQINDKLSRLQAAVQEMVSEAEFKRFKNQVMEKLAALEKGDELIRKEVKDDMQEITELLDVKDEQVACIEKEMEVLKERMNEFACQCERKNNIGLSKSEQLKKGLQQLKEDLEFYKSMNQMMNEKAQETVEAVGQNSGKQNKTSQVVNNENGQDLKRYFSRKLHDQRAYLLGQIRDLEKKLNSRNNNDKDIINIWDKLGEINLFLSKKANEDDIKKNLNYLEKKLASIYSKLMNNDENTEDARVAKTNWFCLSCDKNLSNYKGKVGKHIPWDSMPLKTDHNKFYQEKKTLPVLKR